MKYRTTICKKAFTLVETLVAISILLVVIIGPMTIAQKGIQNAYFAREQVTAVFLAQEAIEAVRKFRDSKGLEVYPVAPTGSENGTAWSWYSALTSDCKNGTGCAYNVTNDTFETCSSGCALKIDANGNYIHGLVGCPTPFTRKVYVTQEIAGEVASVKVDVSWNTKIFGGSTDRHVVLQTWLYNQYKRYEN